MKRTLFLAVAAATTLVACNQQSTSEADASTEMVLETSEQRVSYGMGVGLGQRIKQDGIAIDVDAFARGVNDAVSDAPQLMTQEEIVAEMQIFQEQQIAARKAQQEGVALKNKAEGEAFLAANAQKEGVKVLESGLQYKVITEGTGDKPAATDTVEVHYAGTLIDGTEFDSSYKRGSTVSFPVQGVIPGWTEALQLMPVGSKWQLFIPSDLAYGSGGTGGPIGPNATLLFDVELVAIK